MPLINLARAYVAAAKQPGTGQFVAPEDLRDVLVQKVKPDGKCFWYAMVVARSILAGATSQDVKDLNADGSYELAARRLRHRVCNELWDPRTNALKAVYSPYFAPGEEGTGEVRSAKEYIQGLWTGQVYAGELEVHVSAALTQCTIAVLNMTEADASIYAFSSSGDLQSPLMLVLRNMHYDAVYMPKAWKKAVAESL